MPASPDLTDRQRYPAGSFGRLLPLDRAGRRGRMLLWRCLCSPDLGGCGREVQVTTQSLTSGHTRSCGCLFGRPAGAVQVGMTFGRLTVEAELATDPGRGGERRFRCRCQCGALTTVAFCDLGGGPHHDRQSCRACAVEDFLERGHE